MKRYKQLLVGSAVLCLALLLLVGCGVPQSEYEALQTEFAALTEENASLKGETTSLKGELEAAQSDLTNAQAEYDALESKHDELNANYEAASSELAEIKQVYPPRDFSSVSELRDWLLKNDVSDRTAATLAEEWYSKALEIQEDALKDGYVVSAWIDYYFETEEFVIGCTAVVGGYVWAWDPETDELINFSDGTGLLKLT